MAVTAGRPSLRKMTDEQVRQAWEEYRDGTPAGELCRRYEVSKTTLCRYFHALGRRRGGTRFARRQPEEAVLGPDDRYVDYVRYLVESL